MRDISADILFQLLFFSPAGGHSEEFWHIQGCPLFDVHPVFPLPTGSSRGVLYLTLHCHHWNDSAFGWAAV